jgi:hypothetical protein
MEHTVIIKNIAEILSVAVLSLAGGVEAKSATGKSSATIC